MSDDGGWQNLPFLLRCPTLSLMYADLRGDRAMKDMQRRLGQLRDDAADRVAKIMTRWVAKEVRTL